MPEEVNRPDSGNPFQSTIAASESTEVSQRVPLVLVVCCVLFGLIFNLVLLIALSKSLYIPSTRNVMFVLSGGFYGLGAALLLHAVYTRQLFQLMPGHWRIIASSPMLIGECVLFGIMFFKENPQRHEDHSEAVFYGLMFTNLLAATFYLFVIKYNNESRIWRAYAWLAMVYFFTTAFLFPFSTNRIESVLLIPSIVVDRLLILALFFTLIVAVNDDHKKRTPRDTYHYLGLVLGFGILPTPSLGLILLQKLGSGWLRADQHAAIRFVDSRGISFVLYSRHSPGC